PIDTQVALAVVGGQLCLVEWSVGHAAPDHRILALENARRVENPRWVGIVVTAVFSESVAAHVSVLR
ncbi:hypothetical protein V6O07_18755, partial [Arthrospira platensis SPKY2]